MPVDVHRPESLTLVGRGELSEAAWIAAATGLAAKIVGAVTVAAVLLGRIEVGGAAGLLALLALLAHVSARLDARRRYPRRMTTRAGRGTAWR